MSFLYQAITYLAEKIFAVSNTTEMHPSILVSVASSLAISEANPSPLVPLPPNAVTMVNNTQINVFRPQIWGRADG